MFHRCPTTIDIDTTGLCCIFQRFYWPPIICKNCNVCRWHRNWLYGKNSQSIKTTLTDEFDRVSKYFDKNELVLTWTLGKQSLSFLESRREVQLNRVFSEYGTEIKSLKHHLLHLPWTCARQKLESNDTSYKICANRIHLMVKLRSYYTKVSAMRISVSTILQILTFTNMVKAACHKNTVVQFKIIRTTCRADCQTKTAVHRV